MSARNLARLKLLLLALFCATPVFASWIAYHARLPAEGKTVGTLLPTRPFVVASAAGWPQGRWVLAVVERGACGTACEARLYAARQWQVAQGEAAGRLRRVLVSSSPVAVARDEVERFALPREALADGVYLVDPLGNQVMHYRDDAAPTPVIRELARILKTNNGLG